MMPSRHRRQRSSQGGDDSMATSPRRPALNPTSPKPTSASSSGPSRRSRKPSGTLAASKDADQASVDRQVHRLINDIGVHYIRPWYNQLSAFEESPAKPVDSWKSDLEIEVQMELRRVWLQLKSRLQNADWVRLLCIKAPQVVLEHFQAMELARKATETDLDLHPDWIDDNHEKQQNVDEKDFFVRFCAMQPHPIHRQLHRLSPGQPVPPQLEFDYLQQQLQHILYDPLNSDKDDSIGGLFSREILQSECCMSMISEWLMAWIVSFLNQFSTPSEIDELIHMCFLPSVNPRMPRPPESTLAPPWMALFQDNTSTVPAPKVAEKPHPSSNQQATPDFFQWDQPLFELFLFLFQVEKLSPALLFLLRFIVRPLVWCFLLGSKSWLKWTSYFRINLRTQSKDSGHQTSGLERRHSVREEKRIDRLNVAGRFLHEWIYGRIFATDWLVYYVQVAAVLILPDETQDMEIIDDGLPSKVPHKSTDNNQFETKPGWVLLRKLLQNQSVLSFSLGEEAIDSSLKGLFNNLRDPRFNRALLWRLIDLVVDDVFMEQLYS